MRASTFLAVLFVSALAPLTIAHATPDIIVVELDEGDLDGNGIPDILEPPVVGPEAPDGDGDGIEETCFAEGDLITCVSADGTVTTYEDPSSAAGLLECTSAAFGWIFETEKDYVACCIDPVTGHPLNPTGGFNYPDVQACTDNGGRAEVREDDDCGAGARIG